MSTLVIYKIIIFLLIIPIVYATNINEILYNPIGSDNNKEFIEIYMENPINLEDHIISDGDSNDTLKIKNYTNSSYALILEDDYIIDIPENVSIYTIGAAIGNGLSDNDIISLYNKDNNLLDQVGIFSIQEGYSLEYYNGKFYQSLKINGTPGYENSVLNLEQDFSQLRINELFPNPYGDDYAEMPNGEFVELYNLGDNDINIEGLKLVDEANHELIITNTNTESLIIKNKGYLTVYMNGFFGLLNNEGFEKIRLYSQDQLIDELSYFNSYEDLSWSIQKDKTWKLRIPTPNKENLENEPLHESNLEIENIYLGTDNKAKFGDNLRARLNIYKGNTSKNSVKLFIPELTKETRVNLYKKFTNYTLTLSVQIDPNCNEKYTGKEYPLTLKGLDKETSEEILIEGTTSSLCQKIKQNATKQITYEITEHPKQIEQETTSKIKIINNEPKKTEYTVWSYVSKGNKIITGNSEDNKQIIELPKESSTIIELKNTIEPDAESDIYTYKIKILKETRKTPIVIESTIKINNTLHSENLINAPKFTNKNIYTGNAIYESSSIKARNAGIYIFSALLIILIIILLLKR